MKACHCAPHQRFDEAFGFIPSRPPAPPTSSPPAPPLPRRPLPAGGRTPFSGEPPGLRWVVMAGFVAMLLGFLAVGVNSCRPRAHGASGAATEQGGDR